MKYIIAFILIGLVILLHELGHFIAARITGIRVKIFSIGFGPKLLSWKKGVTEYRISMIPIGGYLLPDINEEKDYFAIPIVRRIIFAAGGPAANIIASIILLALIRILQGDPFINAIIAGFFNTFRILSVMALTLSRIFSDTQSLSGIVGIVAQGGNFIGGDMIRAVHFMSLIGINLAFINLLPFPVFDGGKIMLCAAEAVHPALRKLHVPLSIAGWILIAFLMIYVTYIDIGRMI